MVISRYLEGVGHYQVELFPKASVRLGGSQALPILIKISAKEFEGTGLSRVQIWFYHLQLNMGVSPVKVKPKYQITDVNGTQCIRFKSRPSIANMQEAIRKLFPNHDPDKFCVGSCGETVIATPTL